MSKQRRHYRPACLRENVGGKHLDENADKTKHPVKRRRQRRIVWIPFPSIIKDEGSP
jgi:hypothetical protein